MDQLRKQILVVEDDPRLVTLLTRLLGEAGYEVISAGSGSDALARITEQPPALVILDLRLPDIDGFEVCRKVRQTFKPWTLPILMLTGLQLPVDRLRGYAHGADAYLTKPC